MTAHHNKKGFTLIELMVSISIFAIVATIGIGALLTAHRINQRAQAIKLIMDNLNFAMESITSKMQRGQNFAFIGDALSFDSPKDLLANESRKRYSVYLENKTLKMQAGSEPKKDLTAAAVEIEQFNVDVAPGAKGFDFATIRLKGVGVIGKERVPFAIQTSVSAR